MCGCSGFTTEAVIVGFACNDVPLEVNTAPGDAGTSDLYSRCDHKHDVATAAPVAGAVVIGNAASEGVALSLARSDHIHEVDGAAPVAGAVVIGNVASEGVAGTFSRSDHIHEVQADSPVGIGNALAEGASPEFSRADHVHEIRTQAGVQVYGFSDGNLGSRVGRSVSPALNTGTFAAPKELINDLFVGEITRVNTAVAAPVLDIPIPDDTVVFLGAQVLARSQTSGEHAGYSASAVARRRSGGAAVLIGTPSIAAFEEDAAWNVTATVSGNNLRVNVISDAAQTVDWAAGTTQFLMWSPLG